MFTLVLVLLLNAAPARAGFGRSSRCQTWLSSLATAEADPETLMQVLVSLWPRARALAEFLDAKLRRGWLLSGIDPADVESVLAHTYDVVRAVRLRCLADSSLDLRRAMWMALIHDFPEYLVPDYTPRDPITAAEKYSRELAAMKEIVAWLGPRSEFILEFWLEFEANVTPEARLVRQLDALDATVKACDFERRGYDVSEFFDTIFARISSPRLFETLGALMCARGDAHLDYRAFYFHHLTRR